MDRKRATAWARFHLTGSVLLLALAFGAIGAGIALLAVHRDWQGVACALVSFVVGIAGSVWLGWTIEVAVPRLVAAIVDES